MKRYVRIKEDLSLICGKVMERLMISVSQRQLDKNEAALLKMMLDNSEKIEAYSKGDENALESFKDISTKDLLKQFTNQ